MKFFPQFLAFAASVVALSKPPRGSITVGDGGQYPNLSVALLDTSSSVYFILKGNYTGQTIVTTPNITIIGQTTTKDGWKYTENEATLTDSKKAADTGSNDSSGTLQIHATNVSVYNVNIVNTYGTPEVHSQAIALSVQASLFGCYSCQIRGYQDSLLANKGFEYFKNCYIEGAVDFIFGRTSSIWIADSVIGTLGDGYVTASGRLTNDTLWYVIDNTKITGTGIQYLGRPWGAYARVVVQNSWLDSNIQPAGWSIWNVGDERLDNITFGEYRNSGPGSHGVRANFSTELRHPISIKTVLDWNYTVWANVDYPKTKRGWHVNL
ncbi:pectin lyase-like protein [Flagelloscypha sp. PMI_526]|nr:pectin lyase-like protein [Flagelloscypha sp. PMI_526]